MRKSLAKIKKHQMGDLPKEIYWLLAFQSFNAINFTIILGAPLTLLARYLDASEGYIGLINALAPFMVVLQLTATNAVQKYGSRSIMFYGWTIRSLMLLLIVPLPFMVGMYSSTLLASTMFISILLFTVVRGYASTAWLPWLSSLLSPNQRGHFLGLEQRVMNLTAFMTLVGGGYFLGDDPPAWKYSALFGFAAVCGVISAQFLRRVPKIPKEVRMRQETRSFLEMKSGMVRVWKGAPFRRLLSYAVFFTFAVMAQPMFLILFLKERLFIPEGKIMAIQSAATVGVFLTAVTWGKLTDRYGSRPFIRLADLGVFSTFLFWLLCAMQVFPPNIYVLYLVFFLGGAFISAHAIGQTKLTLGCIPKSETTFGMALFQVIVAVSSGSAPFIFGLIADQLNVWLDQGQNSSLNTYTVVFALFLIIGLYSQRLLAFVPEPRRWKAHHVLIQLFYGWPIRVLATGIMKRGK